METQMATEVYEALEPVAEAMDDSANGFLLRGVVRAIASMFSQVEGAVRAVEGLPAWSQPYDIDRTPAVLIPFVGQMVGVPVTPGLTPEEQRYQVKEEGGWSRQKPSALIAAIQSTLTGTKRVRLTERLEGKAWRMLVTTRPAETPNVALTELVGDRAKPGGLIITYVQSDLPLIDEWTRLISATTTVISKINELSEVT